MKLLCMWAVSQAVPVYVIALQHECNYDVIETVAPIIFIK